MHRDYSPDAQGSAVNVDMYADRLEIVNAGGLFGTVTLDDLRGALATGSCRNQFLATILESTPQNPERPASGNGFVAENRGTGYLVIEQELRRFGKPAPVPRDSLSHFCLTMFKEPPGSDASANAKATENAVSPSLGADAESIEYAIVEIAAGRETVSMRDLMSALNRSRPTVGKYVSDLIRRGILAPTQAKNSPAKATDWSTVDEIVRLRASPGKTPMTSMSLRCVGKDGLRAAPPYTLNLKCMTSPSCTTYSLPSWRRRPASRQPFSPPSPT